MVFLTSVMWNPVSYTHLDVYKRQVLYDDLGLKGGGRKRSTSACLLYTSYKNVRKHQIELQIKEFTEIDYKLIGTSFSQIAKEHGMSVQTCFEQRDLCEYGFRKDVCMSVEEAFLITGKKFKKWKARDCGCVEMVDIGQYNTCRHYCKYCYANFDEKRICLLYTSRCV